MPDSPYIKISLSLLTLLFILFINSLLPTKFFTSFLSFNNERIGTIDGLVYGLLSAIGLGPSEDSVSGIQGSAEANFVEQWGNLI